VSSAVARGLLATSVLLACSSAGRGPEFPTTASFAETPRRPPSFAAEPGADASEPVTDGESIQNAVVPLDSEAARDLVSRFFMAVLLESGKDLFPLFSAQASVLSEGSRQPAQALWRARFAQLDYTTLSGKVVATPTALRTYTYQSAKRAKRDGVPVPAARDEVVIVASPGLSWAGKTRLFGDRLAFRLRPRAGEPAYEIAEIAEDFRLP
jgi:hypothetical protein